MILVKGNIHEGQTELTFHLVSKFLVAIICLISGVMILRKHRHAVLLNTCGLGMVMYSVLNAAGYYGERGDNLAMSVFIVLFVITSVIFGINLFSKNR
jgi:lipopolysaccharide export LptBFGC system permease protein LptF